MKILKAISLIALISVLNTAIAKDVSTILVSQEKQSFNFDFLNEDGITGLQFDVVMKGLNQKNISKNSCVSGVSKSHVGACQFVKNGNLRVIIFSPTNAILESGNIGSLNIGSGVQDIQIEKVTMVRPDLKEITGNILLDVDLKPSLGRESTK